MRPTKETAELTIATVPKARGKAAPAEVLFNEREQIFTLEPQTGAVGPKIYAEGGKARGS